MHIYTNTKIQYIPPNVTWATNTDSKTHYTPEHLDYVLETVDGVTGKAFALATATQFLTVRTTQVNVPLLSLTAAASLAANLVEVKQSKVKLHKQLQSKCTITINNSYLALNRFNPKWIQSHLALSAVLFEVHLWE